MTEFLSEDSIRRHGEYVQSLRLRYSILSKSVKGLESGNIREIMRQRMDVDAKRDALVLLGEIRAHELYFDSFGSVRYPSSVAVTEQYGSCAAFLNSLFKLCMNTHIGFVCADCAGGKIDIFTESEDFVLFARHKPVLAVDMCEHAYFADYGFDKERYLYSALTYLALNKLG